MALSLTHLSRNRAPSFSIHRSFSIRKRLSQGRARAYSSAVPLQQFHEIASSAPGRPRQWSGPRFVAGQVGTRATLE
jgi:hypothetical protein